ncbi:MAG: ABC transporter ATP-binding protein [Candidatus Geothermarchaeales archaeon]
MSLLSVNDIVTGYGKLQVLYGVSLEAKRGEITCIIGPNGAGKSTLLKAIFGILKPWRGKVVFDGHDVTGEKPEHVLKRGLAYILQGRGTFPYMSVLENLIMGAYTIESQREIRERIEVIFRIFPVLKEKKDQLAYTLSGGQQRMLELGRVLVLQPRLLLIDEPSIGLSPKLMNQVYEKILAMRDEEGISLVVVEQNVRKALEIADFIYVLNLGRNAFAGKSQEILASDELVNLYLGT